MANPMADGDPLAADPARTLTRYVVGGAVRDRLLGQPVHDRDWVVVGATVQQMLDAGFTPVGRDFPVFLHPQTHEEHALARTERKTAAGYRGFVVHAEPEVRLEDDLARRDLTINAMAETPGGDLIDPCGGRADLHAGLLRHVSPAFAEDPVRILRVARFAARWPDFVVAGDTERLMKQMVQAGEVDALVPERTWQEVARGLMEMRPSRMLQVLAVCGALQPLLGLTSATAAPTSAAVDRTGLALDIAAARSADRVARLVIWAQGLGTVAVLAARWKLPADEREALALAAREFDAVVAMAKLAGRLADGSAESPPGEAAAAESAEVLTHWFDRCDAFRRPERWRALVMAASAWGDAADIPAHQPAEHADSNCRSAKDWSALVTAHAAATNIDTRAAAACAMALGLQGPAIAAAVLAKRAHAVHTVSRSARRADARSNQEPRHAAE